MTASEQGGRATLPGTGPRAGRRLIAFAGGRGGIGRSVLATNIGVYLAQLGKRVVLVDADLGGASLHTLLGIQRPRSSLTQVIDRQTDHLVQLIIDTPVPNLHLLSGAADRFGVANLRPTQKERLLQQFRSIDADFVLLDVGGGTSFNVLDLFLVADAGVLIAVPEPTSVEAIYRFIKSAVIRLVRREVGRQTQWPQVLEEAVSHLGGLPGPLQLRDALIESSPLLADLIEAARQRLRPWLVINKTKVRGDFELGPAIRTLSSIHLGVAVEYLGYIESDDAVWLASRKRRPVMIEAPGMQAAKDIERICRRVLVASSSDRRERPRQPPRPLEALTHYELLELDVGASEDEIRRSYRRLCDLYQEDALAAYSLTSPPPPRTMLERLQLARDTLLDPKSRRAYDLDLAPVEPPPISLQPMPHSPPQPPPQPMPQPPPSSPPPPTQPAQPEPTPLELDLGPDTEFTGALLRQVREARGVSLRDITARTKIGTTYLTAIEEEDFANLPALVYTRGFVGEVAKFLGLDHRQVVKTYVARYKKFLEESGKAD